MKQLFKDICKPPVDLYLEAKKKEESKLMKRTNTLNLE